MSAAPHPPGRSPPHRATARPAFPRPVSLPPGPRASRSVVLAAARLRALHLDPLRHPAATGQLPRKTTSALDTAPVFIERFSHQDSPSAEVRERRRCRSAPCASELASAAWRSPSRGTLIEVADGWPQLWPAASTAFFNRVRIPGEKTSLDPFAM